MQTDMQTERKTARYVHPQTDSQRQGQTGRACMSEILNMSRENDVVFSKHEVCVVPFMSSLDAMLVARSTIR